ncbi:MAG: ABC transporter permease [Lachnospiraceae bacterium]|nr:ABC transporter permease [Lachnospiraceae bacterium]
MLENVRLSFQGIWSHKMRSFLTMLGVIIGIAAIIAIVSTIKGTNEQIKQNLIGAGNNNVSVTLKQGDGDYWMDGGLPAGVAQFTEEQKQRIRDLNTISNVSFYNSRAYVDGITYGNNKLSGGKVYGVDNAYLSTCGYVVSAGRGFLDDDFGKYRKVAVLDRVASEALFQGKNALGSTIEISGEPFTVVGLIEKADSFQPVINSLQDYQTYHQEEYGSVLIPDTTWPVVYNFDEPQNATVSAKSTEDMSDAGKQAAEIMNEAITDSGSDMKYQAEDLLKKAQDLQALSSSTNSLLLWVASISLLVGGIGVMNIMLVSVTERTSEIGLKKAIGARKNKILAQFLTEAAVLTSIGGVIGVITGIILAKVISKVSGTLVAISVPAIIASVVFSIVIGIIFGMLPSIKAANLNPIDALRHE